MDPDLNPGEIGIGWKNINYNIRCFRYYSLPDGTSIDTSRTCLWILSNQMVSEGFSSIPDILFNGIDADMTESEETNNRHFNGILPLIEGNQNYLDFIWIVKTHYISKYYCSLFRVCKSVRSRFWHQVSHHFKDFFHLSYFRNRDVIDALIVTGGNICFPNFIERIKHEISKQNSPIFVRSFFFFSSLSPVNQTNPQLKLLYTPEASLRRHSTFIGGSIITCLGSFQSLVIPKSEYEDVGAAVFQKRCPW